MKSKFLRKLFGGLSFTTALFIFQACYGTPQDFGMDVYIHGLVKSKKTGLPVKGIKVSIVNNPQYLYTEEDGGFSLYTETAESCKIRFEDIDVELNGSFSNKDTVLVNLFGEINLDVFLEEK